MGTHRVEITQQRNAPVWLSFLQVGQDLLNHQLTFAVRALRGAGRETFDIGDLRLIAIDRCGRAENEVFNVGRAHGIHQTKRAIDVVIVVLQRFGDGFANGFQSREVDDCFDCMIVQDFSQQCFITNITLDKQGGFAPQAFKHRHDTAFTVTQIVEDDDVVAIL